MLGIGLKVASVLVFLSMASFIKLSGDIPLGELVFFRSAFAIPPILIFLAARRELVQGVRTSRPLAHLRRGLTGVMGMFFGFYGLTQLPLPEATVIGYTTPLLIVILSALILKETVRLYRWSAVFIGLVGVGIIIAPQLTFLQGGFEKLGGSGIGALASLTGAFFASLASLAIKDLTRTERSATIALYFSLTCTGFSLFSLPLGWVMPSPEQALTLILVGTAGGIAQVLLTESFRYADMSVIAPFEYTSLVFSILIGWWIFGDLVTWQTVIGALIVVASGIFIILRERALGIRMASLRDQASRIGT